MLGVGAVAVGVPGCCARGGGAVVSTERKRRGKSKRSLELIAAAARILDEIQPASVRAVCYRLFVEGFIDSMAVKNTKRVSEQLVWARESGTIPWEHIVDETRQAERVQAEIIRRLDVAAWGHAIDIEQAETDSMREFMLSWQRGKSGPDTKYPERG